MQEIWGKSGEANTPIDLKLPKLIGADIEEHFLRLGLEQSMPYLDKCNRLVDIDLPSIPTTWRKASGWTRYEGGIATPVLSPSKSPFKHLPWSRSNSPACLRRHKTGGINGYYFIIVA